MSGRMLGRGGERCLPRGGGECSCGGVLGRKGIFYGLLHGHRSPFRPRPFPGSLIQPGVSHEQVRLAQRLLFGRVLVCYRSSTASLSAWAAPKSLAALKACPWAPAMQASPSRLSEAIILSPSSLHTARPSW